METTEPATAVGCSLHEGTLKDEKHVDSEMVQRDHFPGTKDKIALKERPHREDIKSCSSIETQRMGSGTSLPLQASAQKPIYTWRKIQRFAPPGKRCFQSSVNLLSAGVHKKELKVKKTGKYVCHYCGRACAKPSVLKKHIRSHTGERPYPCVPCGFSFKTKSNLYKHRKSHTHAVKAGLFPFSQQDRKFGSMDEAGAIGEGEGEMHSDAEQSTDTDEEVREEAAHAQRQPLHKGSSNQMKDRRDGVHEMSAKHTQKIPGITVTKTLSNESMSAKVSLWQFREMMTPVIVTQVDQDLESSTIKQRLALRLSEKKNQDSLSLPSSYSKGSTDSGYFSRSESAEQQCNQPSANAKSYQEIMFGKCYRPSAKPRQSITVQTCMTDINETPSSFMIKLTKGMAPEEATRHLHRHKKDLARSIKIESESFQEEEYSEIPEMFQCRTELLQTPPECGSLLRSNSLPTPSDSNVSAPQALRSSNSFDERMTNEEISFRSSMGMRKLMRQAAFEHSAHEGHAEPDNHTLVCGLKSEPKVDSADDSKIGIENCPESESCLMFQSHMMENATRKRRKGKNIIEEEDFLAPNNPSFFPDLTGDLCTKQDIQDATYTETERWIGSNVISVIQHTKSLSRLSSAEKSTDFESQQFNKSTNYQLIEKEQTKEKYKTDPVMLSGKIERQYSGSNLIYQWSNLSKQLAFQSGIQVPEIRVTEEPDKPEKVRDMPVRPNEKNREEFQWPQRSETLSNFPVEKLPPKKKRLRLAEMECSSGESSFESACTSLSRSPSQDSNLSHSSSFSQSLDKEEGMNVASPAKSDEFSKCLEYLSVPGSSPSQQREMRRSASEQAPCNLPSESPEFRSKSFDYSNLSFSTSPIQSDIYASDCGFKERRRGCLVRQASLSGDPETHDKSVEMNAQGSTNTVEMGRKMSSSDKQFLLEGSPCNIEKMRYSLLHGSVSSQQLILPDLYRMPEQIPYKQLPPTLQMHQCHGLKHKIKKEPEDSKTAEEHRIALSDLPKDHSQSVTNILSTIAVLSQAQPALANQSLHGLLVPVRIQMQVPRYGNITYTSISHILDSQYTTNLSPNTLFTQSQCLNVTSEHIVGLDACQTSGHPRGLLQNPSSSPAKLNTGIPLSLTSRTISTTEAPSGGASKRILSPASSIELFIEATQQKRVKDENMYGQIVEELSAVELGHPDLGKEKQKKGSKSTHVQNPPGTGEEIEMEDPNIDFHDKAGLPLPGGVSPEAVMLNNLPIPVQIARATLPRDIANTWILSQFSGLHTTTCVSWCYLNCSKPNSTQTAPNFSVYASWFMRCNNPNPPSLSTGKALALLQSKQKKQYATYTIAAMYQPGILVTSTLSSYKQEQGKIEARVEDIRYDTQMKDIKQKCRPSRDNSKETEAPLRQTELARVKIFEGGYKSNEDYVYVRGRGRGKYICEECGIRCKKPSMLKKHIRTHTDVRPYICKCCNFAFKTKGNLTKHMKSKAHLKKCLELGVSPMNMDSPDVAEHEENAQKSSEIRPVIDAAIKHQFSDADDSDGGEEDGDEPDDDEDDEYDGDFTPRTHSRSTSPQPYTIKKTFPSICSTKNLDPKERLEGSSVSNEDDLTHEETSSTFDPCTSQLLSPCWDSPHQRNICLRGDLSPQGHLAPGRAPSPLKPIFSRRDVNIRGDLSPIRQLSPVRPISPVTDIPRYRTTSPRGQHRGMFRATSPRRGSYQHRSIVESSREMKCEASVLKQTMAMNPEMDKQEAVLQNVTDGVRCGTDAFTPPSRGIFSHLPLHSQQQIQTPIPMVPIGGLRMPSVCPSGVSFERHSQSLPQGDISERANSRQASVSIPGPGVSYISSQRKEQPTPCTGLASKDNKQEESVHICAEAIASLRITSEDIVGNPPKS